MSLIIHVEPVPLYPDANGVIRVGDSGVKLDVVIREYEAGSYPESIAHDYDTLQVADVYAVIAYYLRHKDEVKRYLDKREATAQALEQEIRSSQSGEPNQRDVLLKRREEKRAANASRGN